MAAALAVVLGLYLLLPGVWWIDASTDVDWVPPHLRFRGVAQLGELAVGALVALGSVLAAFALLSRSATPHKTLTVRLAVLALSVAVLNFAPQWFGPLIAADGGLSIIPLLAPTYRVHLPLINAWLAAALAMGIWVWFAGARTRLHRWAGVAIGLLGVALAARIILGGAFSHVDFVFKPVLGVTALGAALAASVDAIFRRRQV